MSFMSATLLFCGCVSRTQYDKALNQVDKSLLQIDSLKQVIDHLENGEDRLLGLIDNALQDKQYCVAESNIDLLIGNHPESKHVNKYKGELPEITKFANEERTVIKKAKADSIRLANINELGIWQIGYFVDEFGDPTGDKYVYTQIKGVFENSATAGSPLCITFQINKSSYSEELDLGIKYDEYCDGTEEDRIRHSATAICKNEKLRFYSEYIYYGYEFNSPDTKEEKLYHIDLFEKELKYDFTLTGHDNDRGTKYYYTIDTKYFNNALIKAKLKTL